MSDLSGETMQDAHPRTRTSHRSGKEGKEEKMGRALGGWE
jgi:hypothetical protein